MAFSGKVVWITGASSGIGEALCYALAREGARLVLSSRRREDLERVRSACAHPETHRCIPLDLADSRDFPALAAEVEHSFGPIDLLINNGGISQRALAAEADLAVERALMEVNYFGTIALTKVVLPAMLARRRGHIAVVSSVMGYVGTPGRSTYSASKHALHGYFDSLRAEVWREGVQVTLVCPGYVKTKVSDNAVDARGRKHGQMDPTHQRGISAERCADAIVRGLTRGREEIHVGGFEVAAIYLKRFAPWLFSRIVRRMKFSVGK